MQNQAQTLILLVMAMIASLAMISVYQRQLKTQEVQRAEVPTDYDARAALRLMKPIRPEVIVEPKKVVALPVEVPSDPDSFPALSGGYKRYGPRCLSRNCPARRIKVAFVHMSMPFGGCETQFYRLAQHFDRERFDVHIVLFDDTDGGAMRPQFEALGYNFEIFRVWKGDNRNDMERQRMVDHLRTFDVTYGFYGGGWKTVEVNKMAIEAGVPVNIESVAWTVACTSPSLDAIVADSNLLAQMQHPGRNVVRINVSVDLERFDFDKYLPQGRPNPTFQSAPVVGWLARMVHIKNPKIFVEAAAHIHKKRPDVKFVMYGEGPLLQPMRELASQLNVPINLPGQTHEVPTAMAEMDVYVFVPSEDCNPNVIYEAMSMGCIVVTNPIASIPEVVVDGVNGIHANAHDAQRLADRVLWALDNPDVAKRLSGRAREEVALYHSLSGYIRAHEDLFTELCERKCKWSCKNQEALQPVDASETVPATYRGRMYKCPKGLSKRCLTTFALVATGTSALEVALGSFEKRRLADAADDRIAFVLASVDQQDELKRLLQNQGFRVVGSATPDQGIAVAMTALYEAAYCEYVVFSTDRYTLVEDGETLQKRIRGASQLLEAGSAHLVRLRSRLNGGALKAQEAHDSNLRLLPQQELWAPSWDYEIQLRSDHVKQCLANPVQWCAEAPFAEFSLSPFMMQREFFLEEVADHVAIASTFAACEDKTNEWWLQQKFVVATGDGLFSLTA
eukprot:TRINITY_DN12779_c0_g1_i1.p1 TRINITY_DN12779_c0_g1~~TRINITY_DN12779_c0_g1_i1.p1  ORF type:complete len:734 (+),score=166.79 TRINITY_DN12779_c0_g1_i1:98-2299(+)